MTLSSTTMKLSYAGDGSTTSFSITFNFWDATDIRAVLRDSTGAETVWVKDTEYTITGGNGSTGTLTVVTTPVDYTPASGETLYIISNRSNTQDESFTSAGEFPSATAERANDKLTRLIQQIQEELTRCVKLKETTSASNPELEEAVTGQFLRWAADGDVDSASVTTGTASSVDETDTDTTKDKLVSNLLANRWTLTTKGDIRNFGSADGRLAVGQNGTFLEADSAQTAGIKYGTPSYPADGRITLETGVPISSSDQNAKTTIYYTPHTGDKIALYDTTNTVWRVHEFTELSLTVPATANTMYDLWVYDNSGTLTLEALAWSTTTARATALARQNGIYCKTGALDRRYLGSFLTSGVSGQTVDSEAFRLIWNYYNRVERQMMVKETTNSWTYTTDTWRQANGATTNGISFVIGVDEVSVFGRVVAAANHSASAELNAGVGIGVDSTTVDSSDFRYPGSVSNNAYIPQIAEYRGYPGIGFHALNWLERSTASGTTTWLGDKGTVYNQSGIHGALEG